MTRATFPRIVFELSTAKHQLLQHYFHPNVKKQEVAVCPLHVLLVPFNEGKSSTQRKSETRGSTTHTDRDKTTPTFPHSKMYFFQMAKFKFLEEYTENTYKAQKM